MSHLERFKVKNETYVVAELDDSRDSGRTMRGGPSASEIIAESNVAFETAVAQVKGAADAMMEGLRSLASPVDSLSLEFGVKLTAEAGAVIAKASADAHFVIKLEWKRSAPAKE